MASVFSRLPQLTSSSFSSSWFLWADFGQSRVLVGFELEFEFELELELSRELERELERELSRFSSLFLSLDRRFSSCFFSLLDFEFAPSPSPFPDLEGEVDEEAPPPGKASFDPRGARPSKLGSGLRSKVADMPLPPVTKDPKSAAMTLFFLLSLFFFFFSSLPRSWSTSFLACCFLVSADDFSSSSLAFFSFSYKVR